MNGAGARSIALLGAFLVAHLAQYGLFLLSWLMLGRAALAGAVTGAVIAGWAAAMVSSLVCRAATTWLQAELAVTVGSRLRRRLLRGALALDPSAVRREGTGRLLGRVLETESIEDLAVGGALRGVASLLELVLAAAVLNAALGAWALALLLCWLVAAVAATRRYAHHRGTWTSARMALGNDLAEKIAGHRTRAVQERPEQRHDGEDAALADYTRLARAMDRWITVLALVPRGWALTGMAVLAASAVSGADRGTVAAGAIGVLFTFGTLANLTTGLVGLADAVCAWAQLKPLLPVGRESASRHRGAGTDRAAIPLGLRRPASGGVLIEATAAGYRHPGRDRVTLRDVDLRIHDGDRIVIQGPSGSGKSTLAALLSGSRSPTTGQVLLRGADETAVDPAAWRRRVLAVPQADHNHLILGTLAMNLLIGRGWPASQDDLEAAERTCRALGLGDLLERMPSGLAQIVGETGWQLSHGERSLLFLARALLQDTELLILDETFGALDPHTLATALRIAVQQAPALAVIRQ